MPDDTHKRFTQLMRRGGGDREFLFAYIDHEFGHLFREERNGEAFFAFINGIGNMGQTEQQSVEFVRLLLDRFYKHLPPPVKQRLVRVCDECNFNPSDEDHERDTGSRLTISRQEPAKTETEAAEVAADPKQLAADLYAGGARADGAIALLIDQSSERFRAGGDHAIELFCDWMDILMEGNPNAARKFSAAVLPMLPAETQTEAMIRSLTMSMLKGGQEGADAAKSVFNAMEEVNGPDRARAVIQELLSRMPPDSQRSIKKHLSGRIKDAIR
jgi:hypothetical protein